MHPLGQRVYDLAALTPCGPFLAFHPDWIWTRRELENAWVASVYRPLWERKTDQVVTGLHHAWDLRASRESTP